MNCSQCQEQLAVYVEGSLEPRARDELAAHLGKCPTCRSTAEDYTRLHDHLTRDAAALPQTPLESSVVGRIMTEQTLKLKRIAMRKRYGTVGLGIAAAAAIAAVLLIPSWSGSPDNRATAAEVLAQAAAALSDLQSVYIRLNVRGMAQDNFEMCGPEHDFVPHEMWKQFGPTPKWRVEKPGRVVVMDGESSLLWIKQPEPGTAARGDIDTRFVDWLLPLMDVDRVLDSQLQLTDQVECSQITFYKGADGRNKLVITIEAKAQGDFTNDWLKNQSILTSDHRRIYTFDAGTKRLEDLEVWVHGEEDVLVLDIEEIDYNPEIRPDLFTLALPEDVIWLAAPEPLEDNETYAQMSPDEAARAFFQACADQDWPEVLKFWTKSVLEEQFKEYLGGLEIVSIGKPFKSGLFVGWFVPYEVRLKNGTVLKHNLAVRNDNPAQRYVVYGGL